MKRLIKLERPDVVQFSLPETADIGNEPIIGGAQVGFDGSLLIGFRGFGEASAQEGFGFPVVIEQHEGRLRLIVWSDINQEDPTHIIDLEGARESARLPEPNPYDHDHPNTPGCQYRNFGI
jgi:hypothetical protein